MAFANGESGYYPPGWIGVTPQEQADRAPNLRALAALGAQGWSIDSSDGLPFQSQNPAVRPEDVSAYRARIEQMLKDQKCRDFLEQLLNEAKTQTGKPYAGILATFDQIKFFWGETGAHGGFAHFDHEAPAATINNTIMTERPRGSLANQNDRRGFLISQTTQAFLGETLHHVGEGFTYRDGVMANALNAILVRQGLDTAKRFSDLTEKDIDDASIYWHPKVWAACAAPRN